jgi:carbamoyltransferase
LGAALSVWHKEMDKPRKVYPTYSMKGSYLGPSYSKQNIEKELINYDAKLESEWISYRGGAKPL